MSNRTITNQSDCHIIGAATNYSLDSLAPLLRSLSQIEFRGTLHLLITELDRPLFGLANNAHASPFEVQLRRLHRCRTLTCNRAYRVLQYLPMAYRGETPAELTLSGPVRHVLDRALPVSSVRYLAALDIVRELSPGAQVLLTDTRDVYFQTDPFAHPMSDDRDTLQLSLETHRITAGNITEKWVRELYGHEFAASLEGKSVSCSGTTLGGRTAVLRYLGQMVHEIIRHRNRISHTCGYDQGIHNYLYYSGALRDVSAPPNGEGLYWVAQEPHSFDEEGLIRSSLGQVVPVVHQYDRQKKWSESSAYFRALMSRPVTSMNALAVCPN
jgi:hypothetical protein